MMADGFHECAASLDYGEPEPCAEHYCRLDVRHDGDHMCSCGAFFTGGVSGMWWYWPGIQLSRRV